MEKVKRSSKHSNLLASRQKKFGIMFTFPVIIGLIFVFIPEMVMSFRFSINDIKLNGTSGYTLIPVHFKYYYDAFFVNSNFRRVLLSTITVLWVQALIIIIFSLFISVILNQKFRGRTLARAILFLPVILATGLISKVDSMDLLVNGMAGLKNTVDTGSLNGFNFIQLEQILKGINFMPQLVNTIITAVNGLYDIVLNSGVQILIFLAGLQSIPASLYEAAYVDGITSWQSFWKITIPMISPLILKMKL